MRRRISDTAKAGLVGVGQALPARALHVAHTSLDYVQIGSWLARRDLMPARRVDNKQAVFDHLAGIVGDQPGVLYLEFGVWTGTSMRWWSEHLPGRDARFVGFDSFQGLPEEWEGWQSKGAFDVSGQVPVFQDDRVELVKGWFDDTLPGFEIPAHRQMIINCDADLYSSTATVLTARERWIAPGTVIYFDEFSSYQHERRAFEEYLDRTGHIFEGMVSDRPCRKIAFRRVT